MKCLLLTSRRPAQSARNVGHVGDDRLDAVAATLNLGLQQRHATSSRVGGMASAACHETMKAFSAL